MTEVLILVGGVLIGVVLVVVVGARVFEEVILGHIWRGR